MFDTLINIYECLLISWFLYSCIKTKKKHSILYTIVYTVMNFSFIQLINQYSVTAGLLFVIEVGYTLIYTLLISDNSFSCSLFLSILPFVVFAISNIPILLTLSKLIFFKIDYYKMIMQYQVPIFIFLQLLHTIALYFTAHYILKENVIMTNKDYLLASGILIMCIVMSVCFEAIMLKTESSDLYLLLGMYSVAIICVMLSRFFVNIHKRLILENQHQNEINILKSQVASNQKTIEVQKDLYQLKHDIKHFLQSAKNISINDTELNEQLKVLSNKYDTLQVPILTPIPALNHTLNIARDEAKSKNVDMVCNLNITNPLKIDENDLYLLFSNIFDNALKHIGIKKIINVYAKSADNLFALKVSNSIDKKVLNQQNKIIVNNSSLEHGYGIKTIESIIKKYNGSLLYEESDDIFSITIGLPEHYA